MNTFVKYTAAAAISLTAAFFGDRLINPDHYKAYEHYRQSETEKVYFEYSMAEGLSPEEFDSLYGSGYTLYPGSLEYSEDIPEGNIVRVEWTNEYYVPEKFKEEGKTVLKATYSKGKPPEGRKCDFKNLIDPEEYFSVEKHCYNVHGEAVVSHNEFYMADGQLCTVEITSDQGLNDDWDNLYIIFTGWKEEYISLENGGGTSGPTAYDSGVRSSLSYTYEDRFAIVLDDYSGDGNPDYCIRVGDTEKNGAFYYMQVMNNEGRFNSRNHSGARGCADNGFYVYGETADSIRLGHITRDIYFFLTKNDKGEIVPAAYNSQGNNVSFYCDEYMIDGIIFTSCYENGNIELTASNTLFRKEDHTAGLNLKKLNGKVWRNTDVTLPDTAFSPTMSAKDTKQFPVSLEKGLYRIEIKLNGEYTYTEFYVR